MLCTFDSIEADRHGDHLQTTSVAFHTSSSSGWLYWLWIKGRRNKTLYSGLSDLTHSPGADLQGESVLALWTYVYMTIKGILSAGQSGLNAWCDRTAKNSFQLCLQAIHLCPSDNMSLSGDGKVIISQARQSSTHRGRCISRMNQV